MGGGIVVWLAAAPGVVVALALGKRPQFRFLAKS
jgi:hypothetical protein